MTVRQTCHGRKSTEVGTLDPPKDYHGLYEEVVVLPPRGYQFRRLVLTVLLLLLVSLVFPPGSAAHAPERRTATSSEFGAGDVLEGPLAGVFRKAADEFGVPLELLLAMSYAETRLNGHDGEPSAMGGYGIMHLVSRPGGGPLEQAAALAGAEAAAVRTDTLANVRAGAALLIEHARKLGRLPRSLDGWYPAVADMSGADGWQARIYADQVFAVLARGLDHVTPDGELVRLEPRQVRPRRGELQSAVGPASADYAPAHWVPAHPSNYDGTTDRPNDYDIHYIIIHVTQGSYNSAINWFRNPASGVAAHYVIRSSDGDTTQMVAHRHVGWHAGNRTYNQRSIGIEHEGWVNDCSWFTDSMYRTSAALVRHLTERYHIPRDRQHIIGHNQVPGTSHTDPGPCWNWTYYMSLVNGTWAQTVDNDTPGQFSASANWGVSSWSSQRHGPHYRYAQPAAMQDSAFYRFNIPANGYYDVYGWYPANPGYNGRVRVTIWHAAEDAAGETATVTYMDQRSGGGRWVHLATVPFMAGDDWRIQVSRWAPGPGYVIADAFKVVLH